MRCGITAVDSTKSQLCVGQGRRDPALRAEVLRLVAEARKTRYVSLLAALEAAAQAPGWAADQQVSLSVGRD
jgi:hypothetical protein